MFCLAKALGPCVSDIPMVVTIEETDEAANEDRTKEDGSVREVMHTRGSTVPPG